MDLTTILLLVIGTFNVFLASVIFAHGPKKRNDISYVVLVGMLVFWILTVIVIRITPFRSSAFSALAASHIAGIGIAVSFWYFVMYFVQAPINKIQASLIWLGAVAISLCAIFSRQFIVDILNISELNKKILVGPLHLLFVIYFSGVMAYAFFRLLIAYKKTDDIQRKAQFLLVFWGTFITTIIGSIFNIFMLRATVSDYIGWGPLATIIMVVFITYAIMRHNLMSVKVISAEFFAIILILLLAVRLIISKGLTEWIINGVSLTFAVLFGILLIKNVIKEVEQREKLEILTRQLGEANEKLKELDHMKSEFLSFASHQIKAPLAAIKGFATLIFDGTYGQASDKISEAAHKIKDSADNMTKLVTDFLNVRKIEEGKMQNNLERTGGIKIIKDIFEELKPIAQNKKLDFGLDVPAEEIFINADTQNIRQVFQNIIDNAIKYTDSGFVKVKTEVQGSYLVFSVFDSGHGISKELLPHLFEEFQRDGKEKKIEGTGLGLFIAKRIVESHKGEMWVESEGQGKGSTFFVRIPLAG